jgi:hypothetical protein
MPEQPMELDSNTNAVPDAVCQQQSLATREQAAEWLLRRRIRRGTQEITGRGRALYAVRKNNDA